MTQRDFKRSGAYIYVTGFAVLFFLSVILSRNQHTNSIVVRLLMSSEINRTKEEGSGAQVLRCEYKVFKLPLQTKGLNFTVRRMDFSAPPTRKITADFVGRLGNQMFIYAALLGIAEQNNLKPVIPTSSKIAKYFDVTTEKFRGRFSTKDRITISETLAATYDPVMQRIGDEKNVILGGYLQSWKYFHHVRQKVRDELRFKNNIMEEAKKKFQLIIQKDRISLQHCNSTFVGIHIRRGDFITFPKHVKMGYVAASVDYFKKAMQYMKDRHDNVVFIVASDNTAWAQRNLKGDDIKFVQQGNSAEVDMAILTLCNHTIQSTGTYSWWAAFLTGGDSTYYGDYPRRNTILYNMTNKDDYFYPSWTSL